MAITTKRKPKSFLWLLGLFLIALGILGIAYGVWICYNGILISSERINAITDLLSERGMTRMDGSRALIGIGSAIIILSLLELLLGVIGSLSSGYQVKNLKLFWFGILLGLLYLIYLILGIFTLLPGLINILFCFGFSAVIYYKKRTQT